MRPATSPESGDVFWTIAIGIAAGIASTGFLCEFLGFSRHSFLAFPAWGLVLLLGSSLGAAFGYLILWLATATDD